MMIKSTSWRICCFFFKKASLLTNFSKKIFNSDLGCEIDFFVALISQTFGLLFLFHQSFFIDKVGKRFVLLSNKVFFLDESFVAQFCRVLCHFLDLMPDFLKHFFILPFKANGFAKKFN